MQILFEKKPVCPYCKQQLEKKPTRKMQCPYCRKTILVRKGELLTNDDAEFFAWIKRLENLGITRKEIELEKKRLSKRAETEIPINTTIWSILEFKVQLFPKSEITPHFYYELSRLAKIRGNDPKPYIERALVARLLYLQSIGVKEVEICAYGRDPEQALCLNCSKLHGKKINIDDALKSMVIPRSCTDEDGCRCWYDPV